ncbi:serine hydrolase domain-containing protein [Streptomyces sp. RM1]|uniref:serine hydrolase domain-containing protein n=1 Tax=Streptomyces misionensis TaxID=67331 RepID=UPI003BAEC3F6
MRRRSGRAVASALALLALAAGAAAGTTAIASPATANHTATATLDSALRADLVQYLHAQGAIEHLSALSVRVTYPDGRPGTAVSAGTTTYGGHTPVSDNAVWQIGSNTKAFTSVVLLQLEAERKLSIRDTLGKWLPQYPAWRDITIQQLLSMTSGIPDYASQPAFDAALQADPDSVATAASLVDYVRHLPLGARTYSYSNTNYLLAQLIIERVTRHSYFDEVTRRILRPLGMHHTCFGPETCPAGVASHLPAGYAMQAALPGLDGKAVPPLNLSWAQGAGGLISSLADMTTWDRALYTGRELPAAQQRELESLISVDTSKSISATTADDPDGYGLGVSQQFEPSTGPVWTYAGGTFGFRVLHVYVPETGVLIAIAVNSEVDDNAPALKLFDTVYRTISAFQRR